MTSAWDPDDSYLSPEEARQEVRGSWEQLSLTVPVVKTPQKAHTLSMKHLKAQRRHLSVVTPEMVQLAERPRTRGDCVDGPRPCPWISCRWHLAIDEQFDGGLKVNWPDEEGEVDLAAMPETCTLDVADRGEAGWEEIGDYLNISRQGAEQVGYSAMVELSDSKEFDEYE